MRSISRISLLALLTICAAAAACTTTQSPRRQVADAEITAQMKAKMASDVNLSTLTNVHINSTNGVVTLSGEVENEQVKKRAEEIARSIEGVVSVTDNLQVESAANRVPGLRIELRRNEHSGEALGDEGRTRDNSRALGSACSAAWRKRAFERQITRPYSYPCQIDSRPR